MEIIWFEITRKKDELRATEVAKGISFVAPVDDDGTPVIQSTARWFYIRWCLWFICRYGRWY